MKRIWWGSLLLLGASVAEAWTPLLPLERPARSLARPLLGLQCRAGGTGGETGVPSERRLFVHQCLAAGAALSGFAAAPPPARAASPAVAWPGADAGRVKTTAPSATLTLQGTAVVASPDGRAQLARSEVDISDLAFADLPRGEGGVREGVRRLVTRDPTLAASLLRLSFHDAIALDTGTRIGGANGSIRFELDRRANYGLSRPIEALRPIQAAAQLSWADTIALAGAEAVTAAGGPRIIVPLGRVDAASPDPFDLKTKVGQCEGPTAPGGGVSCRGQVSTTIPDAGLDSDGIRLFFYRLGFTEAETVALMGAHTLGRFTSLLGVPKECLKGLNGKWEACLPFGKRLPFVSQDPDRFSNTYYKWLLRWNVKDIVSGDVHFLPTDVVLVVDASFQAQVRKFAEDEDAFFKSFQSAYLRMVSLGATF